MRNIKAPSERSCTGCCACYAICPSDAICIELNTDGFFEPIVDNSKCIDCGLCQKVCYKFISTETHTTLMQDKPVYGVYSSNEQTHFKTTSGGFAFELSKWGIENGYKIVGVKYDYTLDQAKTIIISSLDDLNLLTGSKYIQSDTSDAFNELIQKAKENVDNKYICIGTPCQIFGLRQLIERRHLKNDFILVDLFCHGVPSYLAWKPYIADKRRELGDLTQVNFRYKGNGWHQYSIKLNSANKEYIQFAYCDPFYRYFFDNIVLNKSCFTCSIRKKDVAADFRLGDFLGQAYEHREDGISAVLVATPRAEEIFKKLQSKKYIVVDRKWEASVCLKSQSTQDYGNILLRNAVIDQLKENKDDYKQIQNWYYRHLPIKSRIKSILKRLVTKLPTFMIIFIRKTSRTLLICGLLLLFD